jgi:hypothetical protein
MGLITVISNAGYGHWIFHVFHGLDHGFLDYWTTCLS